MTQSARTRHVDRVLEELYPEARLALAFESPLQLLVAVILSAQCTDERVNAVTPGLFARFPAARDLAKASQEEVEELIRPTGFYRNKARMIRACCAELVARFGGRVPDSVEDLVTLPGVGRKTANMVAGNAFATPGIAVDTHVARVAARLELSAGTTPDDVERTLRDALPSTRWTAFGNRMILFGRQICTSRKPHCGACRLADICPFLRRSRA